MTPDYMNTILISPDDIKASTNINYNVDDNFISYTIRRVQDIYLQEIIGTKLYVKLLELAYNSAKNLENNFSDPENEPYYILLVNYIDPYLAAKVNSDIALTISYKYRNKGVVTTSDTNVNNISISDNFKLMKYYDTAVEKYGTTLTHYLNANLDLFPELELETESYEDKPKLNQVYANTGLWLGKNKKTCL